MRLHPINPAEGIIAPFFDPGFNTLDEWKITPSPFSSKFEKMHGYTTTVAWDSAEPDREIFTMSWEGSFDVSGYDGLFVQASFPNWVKMIFMAKADGVWQDITSSRGADGNEDYMGGFKGKMLEGIKLVFISDIKAGGGFNTYYLGVYNTRRLEDWLEYENPTCYDEKWADFLLPPDSEAWTKLTPGIGMFFDSGDIEKIRAKLNKPPYKESTDILRLEAKSYTGRSPEKQIRTYLPVGEAPRGYSARSRDRDVPFARIIELCGFFGLIDDDKELKLTAARHAISALHMKHWCEGFVENDFPGSAMNWRSFFQNILSLSMTQFYDWYYDVLTPHAKEVMSHALFFKALAPLKHDLARYEYMYSMNQAAVFSAGRIACAYAISKLWPRMGYEIDQAQKDLNETMNNVVFEDGGYGEGPNYFNGAMFYTLISYILLSRYYKRDVGDIIPLRLYKCIDYYSLYLSSIPGGQLSLSDGGGGVNASVAAMFAYITQDDRWNKLLYDAITRPQPFGITTCESFSLIYGADIEFSDVRLIPVFAINENTGHAVSMRRAGAGPVLFHFCGSSKNEGHSHQDKGSFILEAFGKEVFIDRGITKAYNDPLTGTMKIAKFHNTFTYLDEDGVDAQQFDPAPWMCPSGKGDANSFELTMDVTGAWKKIEEEHGRVLSLCRTIVSPDPFNFVITDNVRFSKESVGVFNLNTFIEPIVTEHQATYLFDGFSTTVAWDWDAVILHAGVELCNGEHKPVYRLAIGTKNVTTHSGNVHIRIIPD